MVRCCSVAPCCCAAAPRRVACKLTNPALPAQLAFGNNKKPQATPPRMPGVNISSFFVKKQKAAHGLQLIGARSNEAVRVAGARSICGMIARRGLASEARCKYLREVEQGQHLTTFCDSTAPKEMWMDFEDALTLFKGEHSSMGCVIVTDGTSTNVNMYMEGSDSKAYLERNMQLKDPLFKTDKEGDECMVWTVDPMRKTCILYLDGVHFCAVVGKEWALKPGSESPCAITVSKEVQDWLDFHSCILWPSTGNGFCGYESLTMPRRSTTLSPRCRSRARSGRSSACSRRSSTSGTTARARA